MKKDSVVKIIVKIMKLIGKLLILIAVIVLAIGGFSLINTRSFLAKAVEADGTVVKLEERDSGYSPVFRFSDNNGKEHTIYSSTSSYPPEYEVGEKIQVLYKTENPKKARINSFWDLYLVPVVTGVLGGFYILIGLILVFLIPVFIRKV